MGGTPSGPAIPGERLMPLNDLHRRVATIALRAANRYGVGLGGGNALTAPRLTHRPPRALGPGLEERAFAGAGRRLDRWGDVIFAPFGLGPADVAALRATFAGWP